MKVHVQLSLARRHLHLLGVEMRVSGAPKGDIVVASPEWVPGHYALMNNARFVQDLRVEVRGEAVPVEKIDKQSWRVSKGDATSFVIRYDAFGRTLSSAGSLFDDSQCHLNGGSVFVYLQGHRDVPYTLSVRDKPRGWDVATGLPLVRAGRWSAPDYDELIDCPIKIARLHHRTFHVDGKPHHVVLTDTGDTIERLPRFVRETEAFVRYFAGLFGGLPYDSYWFLCDFHPTRCKGGALEHRNSTHLAIPLRLDTEDEDAYLRILAVACHEYFHLWNVKRIRPFGLGPFDYTQEAYSSQLWAVEGFTDYYAWYGLRQAGAIDVPTYLRWVGRYIDQLHDMPGRRAMTLREASWNVWNQDGFATRTSFEEMNTINRYISYYVKGAVMGALLDVELRAATDGRHGLDEVFRGLWKEAGEPEGYLPGRVEAEVERVGGRGVRRLLERWVGTTAKMPYRATYAKAGLSYREVVPTLSEDAAKGRRHVLGKLGVELMPEGTPLKIRNVDPDGAGAEAGLLIGDELLALDGRRLDRGSWRRLWRAAKPGTKVAVTLYRHDTLLTLEVVPRKDARKMARLEIDEGAAPAQRRVRKRWLGPDVHA